MKAAAKKGIRRLGVVTAPVRQLPDFLVIGAKRGGTTSLFNYLLQHPCVPTLFPSRSNIKGVHFFDTNFARGVAWYRSHFPSLPYRAYQRRARGRETVAGEASPYYIFHPHAPRRAHRVVPAAKLIVLLRNPVDRAYSHYRERVRHAREPLSFEEAVEQEPVRLKGEVERMLEDESYYSYAHEQSSYVSQGIYVDQLKAWLELYSRDRVCILRSEDFYADPQRAYDRVLAFLGLPPWQLRNMRRYNFHPSLELKPSTIRELAEYFAPHNQRLGEYLGMDLGWDTPAG